MSSDSKYSFTQGLIKSLIQSPYDALAANTWMALEVAGVRLTAEIGLATILGDSEDGLTVSEIAEKTSVDGDKLGSLIKPLHSSPFFRLTYCFKNVYFVSSSPRAGSAKPNRVTLPIIVSATLSRRVSLDTIWLRTCECLEF